MIKYNLGIFIFPHDQDFILHTTNETTIKHLEKQNHNKPNYILNKAIDVRNKSFSRSTRSGNSIIK